MTDDNSNLVDMDDLDKFEESFFEKETKEVKEVVDTEDDALETDKDTDAPAETGDDDKPAEETEDDESEASDSEDESNEDEDEEKEEKDEKPQKKGKGRKSFQERIDELTRQRYEIERRAQEREAALLRRLEALETQQPRKPDPEPIAERLPQDAPKPDAVDADGELIYPLGEFDPKFVSDLARFSIRQEAAALEEERAKAAAANEIAQAQEALKTSWEEKLEAAEQEKPEIRENIASLVNEFSNVDPAYGEYLAMTIMSSEAGPEIMDYLSQNIGEAQKIVASGPAAATLAIGRLEAKLASANEPRPEEEKRNRVVSHAPTPPTQVTRGRKGGAQVRPDTDDLDAFERLYYGK